MNSSNKKTNLTIQCQQILESISDGVFTVNKDWQITSLNKSGEKLLGISREEAIGKLCSEVFKSSVCETSCPLRQTLENETPIINKLCYIINSEGHRIPISISTAVLRDKKGQIVGGAETFRDLSEIEALKNELTAKYKIGDFISHSPAMKRIFELIPALANSSSTVLIQGETGTGKEILAKAIHSSGDRQKEPFIAINCGAIPENLLESELFGYKKGAFTGANNDKPGRFAQAGKGTIFLDEIGEISLALQVKLLRVLQEKTYEPLGSNKSKTTNARIIAATNKDLKKMIKSGTFREDLYYRINVINLKVPPLKDRIQDIPYLVDHFINRFNHLQHRQVSEISPEIINALMAYHWPGNIRELENSIERAFILCSGNTLELSCFSEEITGNIPPRPSPEANMINKTMQETERQLILATLKRNNFNRAATAKELRIHKTTLYRKIKALNIDCSKKE